ncbi:MULTISPECIES: nucleotide disphospho-sugar-binding domain-containing protein [unclassified Crossiella]|uniref:nucleotide disphospho-sugar-binding domain-containing protein n=1 Tax=unclassified Crossiella TaxID=2620835 RepID=UPI0020004A09|nr:MULTISPECIES: nucleotide disphospho-sugar-binding domain-containing protein [unclassified Crossiella]MCK2241763.1 DUF1205 domain-containing protein [Crossiella sp. S99.2]MCK2255365.1 DUF1205 domain-containing protein [Crossiella sp. S99.1]
MRVLFVSFPAAAHVYPMVPLAWSLQAQCHEVRVAVHPSMAHEVGQSGLPAIAFGSCDNERMQAMLEFNANLHDLEDLDNDLAIRGEEDEPWHKAWLTLVGALSLHTPDLPELVALCRDWKPDLVLWDPLCIQAAVAAEATGIPHARLLWGQDNVGWLWERYSRREPTGDMIIEGSLDWMMAPMLEPYGLEFSETQILGQSSIDQRPAGWRIPTGIDYLPMRWAPYNGGAVAQSWVTTPPPRPRVVMTFGTSGRGRLLFHVSGSSFEDTVRTLCELDIELVVTLDKTKPIENPPENLRIIDYVPLSQILPTCAVIINHAGEGSVMTAGVHEVPQLLCPVPNWGEHNVARGVAATGNGLVLAAEDFTPEKAKAALSRLLTEPEFRAGAARFRRELDTLPFPAELIPLLTERVRAHQGGGAPGRPDTER